MSLSAQLAGDASAAEIAFSAAFRGAFSTVVPTTKPFVQDIDTTNRVTLIPAHARLAKMRRWDGERITRSGGVYSYQVSAETYELSLGIKTEDFEDDQLGAYTADIEDMAMNAGLWQDDLVVAALIDGGNGLCYDGLSFFNNAHVLGSSTIDNNFTGTALNADNYNTVRSLMQSWTDESGSTLRCMPNTLIVPPALERAAREIVASTTRPLVYGSNTAAAQVDNVMAGTAGVIVLPQLAAGAGGSDTAWYLMDTSRKVKPMLFVTRKKPVFSNMGMQSEHNFKNRELLFGVEARGSAAYGKFWLAARATA